MANQTESASEPRVAASKRSRRFGRLEMRAACDLDPRAGLESGVKRRQRQVSSNSSRPASFPPFLQFFPCFTNACVGALRSIPTALAKRSIGSANGGAARFGNRRPWGLGRSRRSGSHVCGGMAASSLPGKDCRACLGAGTRINPRPFRRSRHALPHRERRISRRAPLCARQTGQTVTRQTVVADENTFGQATTEMEPSVSGKRKDARSNTTTHGIKTLCLSLCYSDCATASRRRAQPVKAHRT